MAYDPKATTHLDDKGMPYRLRLKPDQLMDAAYEFAKVDSGVRARVQQQLAVPGRENDPLRNCPACARTFRPLLDDGRWQQCAGVMLCAHPLHHLLSSDATSPACGAFVTACRGQHCTGSQC